MSHDRSHDRPYPSQPSQPSPLPVLASPKIRSAQGWWIDDFATLGRRPAAPKGTDLFAIDREQSQG